MKIAMSNNNQLVDSCLVLQEKAADMPKYIGQPELQQTSSYSVDVSYHPTNGQSENHSPNSSRLSMHSGEAAGLIPRSQKQQTTQQVTTLTKVVHEVHHVGPDGQSVDYVGVPYTGVLPTSTAAANYPQTQFPNYELMPGQEPYPSIDPAFRYQEAYRAGYQDYEQYPYTNPSYTGTFPVYGDTVNYVDQPNYAGRPATPPSPSERSDSPPLQSALQHDYLRKGGTFPQPGYEELDQSLIPPHQDHYRITPSPGGPGDRYVDEKLVYGYAPPSPYSAAVPAAYGGGVPDPRTYDENCPSPRAIFEDGEELRKHLAMHPSIPSPSVDEEQRGMRWRDPNLTEVIGFLNNPNNVIKANAAAYLQHLCYMDDPNKQKTRSLGGIPPLVSLLSHETPDVYRNACGALRNLSYGRQNDENKRAIKNAGGIPSLISLLRKSADAEVKELVTGVLWNLSSCEDLKRSIIDDGLQVIVNNIIIPHSGWDPNSAGETCWTTIFRNASGVLRNVSSAGEYARKKLRECEGLVDSLLYVVRSAIDKSNIGNKSVENCVCVLRNLSYRCQEVEDPNYDKHPLPTQSRMAAQPKGDNLGCFGASKKKKECQHPVQPKEVSNTSRSISNRTEPIKGMELLWQPEVVQSYLQLLQSCSNPETLEAAAGALQNLAACYWQPSIEIRAAVRKEKGLPILVELLRMEVDRVVCAVATALRNLAIDQRNKELIGKYAMRDLVQKLPSGNPQHDQGTSDDTIAAVLATLNEVIKKNAEFSRSLLEAGGVERLMNITRQRQRYTPRVLKFAGQVLYTMWQHQELREVYKKHGWKEQDFVTKTVAARNAGLNSPNNVNNTLNRPMASQGGTRYEDRTMQRPANANSASRTPGQPVFQHGDEIPMADMSYTDGSTHGPASGCVRNYPPTSLAKPGEPLYAQVNREKKKNRQYEAGGQYDEHILPGPGDIWGYEEPSKGVVDGLGTAPQGGDSWV
ncbi:catenin delta-2 isoform X2 [Bacillus rossius redtenbacheri]|uniref:catenin delta-2 isoform X2 n=1 Tax=Bacillus rossius redtenbacheri TaxID=93214 RepID=UPI002FDEA692